ncbi:hypothetical protein NC652_027837 [Populus alba x Populus x berolinensis]|nr:hypothetical protein NC652_027837 [Populus alba x Populus x berolinensis]
MQRSPTTIQLPPSLDPYRRDKAFSDNTESRHSFNAYLVGSGSLSSHLGAENPSPDVSASSSLPPDSRLGESADRSLLDHLLKMFTSLGIYAESFERPFLECTSEFYAAEGMKYMQQSDVPDYLKHVESRLNEEQDRCNIYVDASTKKPLIATAETQLLERHISAILDKGFMMLMEWTSD